MLSFRCFQNIHSAAFTDKNLPLFSLDGYLEDHLPRIQKEDQWDTVSYFFKEMLKQRDELKRLEDMEREVMAAVQRCLEGRTGGSLARFTDEKIYESRITDIEISFSRITKIRKKCTFLSCSYATKSV